MCVCVFSATPICTRRTDSTLVRPVGDVSTATHLSPCIALVVSFLLKPYLQFIHLYENLLPNKVHLHK